MMMFLRSAQSRVGRSFWVLGVLAIWTAAIGSQPLAAEAIPRPAGLYGTVAVDGAPIPVGAELTVTVNDLEFVMTALFPDVEGTSFKVNVPADDPQTAEIEGARLGETVVFKIDGIDLPETVAWQSSRALRHDMTVPVGADLRLALENGVVRARRGEVLTYTLTVDNPSTEDASSVDVTAQLPPHTVLLAVSGGATVDSGTLAWPTTSLAAGETLTQTFDVRVLAAPESVTSILASAEVRADTSAGFDPDRENNSAQVSTVLEGVGGDLPDLAVRLDNVEITPVDPAIGDLVTVSATVRNLGETTALGVPFAVYDDDPDAGGTVLVAEEIDELPAAGSRRLSFEWTVAEGVATFVAVADREGFVFESDETNNRSERSVVAPPALGPDLEIVTVDTSGVSQDPADLFLAGSVSVEVANTGDADADKSFIVRVFEEREGLEVELARADVPALPQGATHFSTLPLDVPADYLHPLVWIEVDAEDDVLETDESDNRVALFGDCALDAPAAAFAPVVEWSLRGLDVQTAPVVVQLSDDNDDGLIDSRDIPDVVVPAIEGEERVIVAVSGLDGERLWTFTSSTDHPLPFPLNHPAAGDLDGDGVVEVVAALRDGRLLALEHDGTVRWTSPPLEGVGERTAGSVVLGDLDGDAVPEIVVGRTVLSASGEVTAVGTKNRGQNENFYGPFGVRLTPGATGYPHAVVADLDLDGRAELVAGDTVYRLEGGELVVAWDRVVPDRLMDDGFSAVGNLDSDPEAEIVVVSSNQIMVLDHDGAVRAGRREIVPLATASRATFWGGAPTIADLDGDGLAEIVVAGDTEVVAFRQNLSVLWRRATDDQAAITSSTAFDLDGDGAREVLYLDNGAFYVLDGRTGEVLYERPNTSKTATEHPVVADVDGDGRAEILLPSNTSFDGNAETRGLHVLGHPGWTGTRPIWNQYGYHVVNVELDGTIPAGGTPSHVKTSAAANTFRVNEQRPAPRAYRPNLSLALPRIGEATTGGVPVTLRLGNGGGGHVTPGTSLAFYLADTFTGDPASSEPVFETVLSEGLRPGSFRDITIPWQVPTNGMTAVVAVVDADAAIAECDEADNAVDFIVDEVLLPDLVAASLTAPATVFAGQLVPVSLTLRNDGLAVAPPVVVRLAGGTVSSESAMSEVRPGETLTLELLWDSRGAAAGAVTLIAEVDVAGSLEEADESNNAAQASLTVAAPTKPDLAAAAFVLAPSTVTEGRSVTASVTVVNRGADLTAPVPVSFRLNGAELGRGSLAPLAAGTSAEVAFSIDTLGRQGILPITAVLDPDQQVDELDETNNVAGGDLDVVASSFRLGVSTDRLTYDPREDVTIDLVAANDTTETPLELLVRILDPDGETLAEVARESLTLAPGDTARSFTWNTATFSPGPYTILAELRDVASGGDAVRARGVAGVSLTADIDAEATLFANRTTYAPNETASLMGSVTNLGVNTSLTGTSLRLDIFDAENGSVFLDPRTLGELLPGESTSFDAAWAIGDAAPGEYTATASVRDASGRLLAFASTKLTVESTADTGAGLLGELAVTPGELGAGATLVSEWSIENTGNTDLSRLVARVDLVDLATEEVLDFADTRFDLAQDASRAGVSAFDTGELPPADYMAVLSALVPAGPLRLDAVTFTVRRGLSVADVELFEGDAGSRLARFDVTLSSPSEEVVSASFQTVDATAAAGFDYVAASGTLELLPGETVATVEVEILGDVDVEVDEVFLLGLAEPAGALLGDAQALGTIRDEEGCASPELLENGGAEEVTPDDTTPGWTAAGVRRRFAAPGSLGGAAYFGVAPGGELEQALDLEPFAAAVDAGLASFALDAFVRPGGMIDATAAVGEMTVELSDADGNLLATSSDIGSGDVKGWQMLGEILAAPAGARRLVFRLTNSGDVELHADLLSVRSVGRQTVSVLDAVLNEGTGAATSAVFRLALACPADAPLALAYTTAPGTAIEGEDFTATAGDVTFAAGAVEAIVAVPVTADAVDEDDLETFSLVLSAPPESDVVLLRRVATGTIRDDDGAVAITVADAAAVEGAQGFTEMLFEIALDAPSGRTVEVDVATIDFPADDGRATFSADYLGTSATLVFAPGETLKTFPVQVIGDLLGEGDETFRLRLSNPLRATLADGEAIGTIRDDDEVAVAIGDVTRLEGGDGETVELAFPVTLSLESARTVEVAFTTADAATSPATAGEDYLSASGTLVFAPGVTEQNVTVTVLGDAVQEEHEAFLVLLSEPTNAVLARPEATGTIFDDDGVLISIEDAEVDERNINTGQTGEARIAIVLNQPSAEEVTVDFATVDGTATAGADYVATTGTVVFPPGTTRQVVTVAILDDVAYEPVERFTVTISGETFGQLLDADAEVKIHDEDGWAINFDSVNNFPYDPPRIDGCLVVSDERELVQSWGEFSAWRVAPVDLARSFDKTFRVFFGRDEVGGEGMVFALQTNELGALGQKLGYRTASGKPPVSPSVGVEMWISGYRQNSEPAEDHLSIAVDGELHRSREAVSYLPPESSATYENSTTPFLAGAPNVEDGKEHELRVHWNAESRLFDISFDGVKRLRYERDEVAIGGATEAYYGFTGRGNKTLLYFCETEACTAGHGPTKISIGDARVVEGDDGTVAANFAVTLSCPVDHEVRVEWTSADLTAEAGSDYLAGSGTVIFSPGETSANLVVDVVGDTRGEAHEHFRVELSQPVGGEIRDGIGEGEILSDEALVLLEPLTLVEGDPNTTSLNNSGTVFPVRLAGPVVEPVVLRLQLADGSADSSTDYWALGGTNNGWITFEPGEVEKQLSVKLRSDARVEGDEEFFVDVTNSSSSADLPSTRMRVAITDDDALCTNSPNLLVNGSGTLEGVDGFVPGWTRIGNIGWDVPRRGVDFEGDFFRPRCGGAAVLVQDVDVSGFAQRIDLGIQAFRFIGYLRELGLSDRGRITVDYLDGSKSEVLARVDSDAFIPEGFFRRNFWARMAEIRRAPVGTRFIRVRLETLALDGEGCDTSFDALEISALDTPLLSIDDRTVTEGQTGSRSAPFGVHLGCAQNVPVTVDYLTADASAVSPADFTSTRGTLIFSPGEVQKTVDVPVHGDTVNEGDETFRVLLVNPTEAGLADAEGVGTIRDDEIFLRAFDASAPEGESGTSALPIIFRLTGSTPIEVRVGYRTVDGTAKAGSDYVATSGTLTFPPGQARDLQVEIPILGDLVEEEDECFTLELEKPVNVSLEVTSVEACISNDDQTLEVSGSEITEGQPASQGTSGESEMLFEVRLSQASTKSVRVGYRTSDGTARAGEDYAATSGTVEFNPGEVRRNIAVTVFGDLLAEASETFFLTLENAENAALGTVEATGIIIDDDDCQSANLVTNGGAEALFDGDGELFGWSSPDGSTWRDAPSTCSAFTGKTCFNALETTAPGGSAELVQEVDVSRLAERIDGGLQRFLLEGAVFTRLGDPARIVAEYRDGAGTLLGAFDTGEIFTPGSTWEPVSDLRLAPAGTRTVLLRLLTRAVDANRTLAGGHFDALALRALGRPTLHVPRPILSEPDEGTSAGVFELLLGCAAEEPVTVDVRTVADTAQPLEDYLPVETRVSFAPGETRKTVEVPIVGDTIFEPVEDFRFEVVSSSAAPAVFPSTVGRILDDDTERFLTIDNVVVAEGDPGDVRHAEVTLRLSAPNGEPSVVDLGFLSRSARLGEDFEVSPDLPRIAGSSRVSFAADESVKTILVPIVSDDVVEGTEFFAISTIARENIAERRRESQVRILDDDDDGTCTGESLLRNGGGEDRLLDKTPADWTVVSGTWRQAFESTDGFQPEPVFFMVPKGTGSSELTQEIDLAPYAGAIAGGTLRLRTKIQMRVAADAGRGRVVVDHVDVAGTVLASYDSGWRSATGFGWLELLDSRLVPAGTVAARVRLLGEATEFAGPHFDLVELRPQGAPTLTWSDTSVAEGDPAGVASFDVRLSCPVDEAFEVPFATIEESATAGADFVATSGVLTFAPGEILKRITVPILDDAEVDPNERFRVRLDGSALSGVALPESERTASIQDDDNLLLDLGLCLDNSSSVGNDGFVFETEGTSAAVEDPSVLPRNATVRLTVLQFGNFTRVALPPTILDENNVEEVTRRIRGIWSFPNVAGGRGSDVGGCLAQAANALTQPSSEKQVIDLSTDGELGVLATIEARDDARRRGVDVLNVLLLDERYLDGMVEVVYPQPEGGPEGFVELTSTISEYAAAMKRKMRREINPDLVVTLDDGLETVDVGLPLVYTATVENAGFGLATTLEVDFALAAGLENVTVTPSAGVFDTATGLWSGLELDTGDGAFLEISATAGPAASGDLATTVTILPAGGVDARPEDNSAVDVTTLTGRPELELEKTARLTTDADGDTVPSPGDTLTYTLTLANTGDGAATGVVLRDLLDENTLLVPGSIASDRGTVKSESPVEVAIGTLEAGATATVTFDVAIANPIPVGVEDIENQATALSNELPAVLSDDPALAGDADPTVTMITAAPRLVAEKVDALAVDADSDGVPSPGDTLEYAVTVRNLGNVAATSVAYVDLVPKHTALVAGSVGADAGTVAGTVLAESPIEIELAELPVGETLVVTSRVTVANPLPAGVLEVTSQGAAAADGVADVLTDDPDAGGDVDPTVTSITAAPVLVVEKTDVLFADLEEDGDVTPGDELLYRVTVANTGNIGATEVVLEDILPAETTLVPATVQASQGTILSESPITVDLGTVPAGTTADMTFRVTVDPAIEVETITNQATVTAAGLEPVASDDPETADVLGDPTATTVILDPDLSLAGVTVEESATTAAFELTFSRSANRPVTIFYRTVDGTATGDVDYASTEAELVIPAGELGGAIEIPLVDDLVDEPDESFTLELLSVENAKPLATTAAATIVDDDPVPAISITGVRVDESASGAATEALFAVTMTNPSSVDVVVSYETADATAVAGSDYTASAGTILVPAGALDAVIAVPILDDILDENDETFTVTLLAPQNAVLATATGAATATILDDDLPPEISIEGVTVDEGSGDAVLTVRLSAPSGSDITASFSTADGTAGSGTLETGGDYASTTGSVALAAGETTATVRVALVDDPTDEPEEGFTVTLAESEHATLGAATAVVTITDNDPPPTISIDGVTVTEGDSGETDAVFLLTLDAPSGFDITVRHETLAGTAEASVDFRATTGTATLPAGETAGEIRVAVLGDTLDELDENFIVTLSEPVHVTILAATAEATIVDDDEALISIDDVVVSEGDGEAQFTLRLAVTADREIRVDAATDDATALAGEDYLAAETTLVFPAGTTSQSFAVAIVDDGVLEDRDETFRVLLANAVETEIEDGEGVATIVDDEVCAGPNLLVNPSAEVRGESRTALPGWTLDSGDWRRRFGPMDPVDGRAFFAAGTAEFAELYQDIDVRAFADRIAAGEQAFAFEGSVRTFDETPPDVVRLVVEYRDATNTVVLDAFDSGEIQQPRTWRRIEDVTIAPAGTGFVRVRLVGTLFTGETLDVFVDALSLRPLRAPTVSISDVQVYEQAGVATLDVDLACVYEHEVGFSYATVDGSALAFEDYELVTGSLLFPVGTTHQVIDVPLVADDLDEPVESFFVELSGAVSNGAPVLLDTTGEATILDDDFCPRSHGFWKTHREDWPVDWLLMGGVEYEADEMMAFLEAKGGDATLHLALQLVAAKLNLARGGDPFILPSVEAADALLELHPPGSDPRGPVREEADRIKNELDAYNNIPCPEDEGDGGGGNGGGNGGGGNGSGNGGGNGGGNSGGNGGGGG